MSVDLEAALGLAHGLDQRGGRGTLIEAAPQTIRDLVAECRRLRAKVEASDSYLDGIENERDEARRQLERSDNDRHRLGDHNYELCQKLTMAREALEFVPKARFFSDAVNRAREALAKIGGSDDP